MMTEEDVNRAFKAYESQNLSLKGGRRVGRRGLILILFGFVDLIMAWAIYSYPNDGPTNAYAGQKIMLNSLPGDPLDAWALIWLAVAMILFVNAFRRSDRVGYAFAYGIKLLWASCFTIATITGLSPRAWVGTIAWALIAAVCGIIAGWPEGPRKKQL